MFQKGDTNLCGTFWYLKQQTFFAAELQHWIQDLGHEIQVFSEYFLLQLCSLIRELAFGMLTVWMTLMYISVTRKPAAFPLPF